MKNDEQMYQSVLSRRDAYRERKNQRIRTIRRTVPAFACLCLTIALSFGYRNHLRNLPDIPVQSDSMEKPSAETTDTAAVSADAHTTVSTETPSGSVTAAVSVRSTETEQITTGTKQAETILTDITDADDNTAPELTTDQPAETQASFTAPPATATQPVTEPPVITTAEAPQTTETEPVPPEEPIGFDAQPIPFADIYGAADAVNAGDVSAYTGEERHAYRGMFQRMKKDGFLYQVTETDAVTLRDDLPVYLFPETLREDAGIGYYVTYREKNYHITFCYADDITAVRTDGIADYLQKRMGRRNDKTITVSGTNVSLFFADNGQNYAGALIDKDHYYTVNTAASADEMIEFLESFRYDRFSLT